MKLTVNGEQQEVNQDQCTVAELLTILEVKMPEMVSVELNGTILSRDQYQLSQVADGDQVEFIYFMGGGVKFNDE